MSDLLCLREKLKTFIGYEEGEAIRTQLHERARKNYQPRHADKYLSFMNENECTFDVNHAQSSNQPYYFTLFTVKSQHVMGDCVEECLDKAIEV